MSSEMKLSGLWVYGIGRHFQQYFSYIAAAVWGVRDTTLCVKFVSDLLQVGGFLRVLRFPPLIKLPQRYNWNIVESGVQYHKPKARLWLLTEAKPSLGQ
jgi:hypothetical protein